MTGQPKTVLQQKIDNLVIRIYRLAGEEFDLNKPNQVLAILRDKMGMSIGEADDASLQGLADQGYALPSLMVEYRALSHLNGAAE